MFYKSYSMHENYLTYRDIIFVNKRFTKTWFNKILLLFCGVNNQGKSVIFGISMINKEDEDTLEYSVIHFKNSLSDFGEPKLFVIERNSLLKSAI